MELYNKGKNNVDVRPLIRDYKHNVPLHMLEAKYKMPIHKIIAILHEIVTRQRIKDV